MELYNIEAEQSILGAILIEPKSISEGNEVNLSASDFYLEKHRILYKCMKKLSDSDLEIDLIILSNELKNDNMLDEIGGLAYISSLITIVPTSSNILYYMKIVKNLAMKRYIYNMLLQAGTNIQSMDTNDLINFTDELKSTLLECSNVNDLFIDASTISLKTENAGAIETGFMGIDKVTGGGLNFGTLTVVTGEPGSGKSTFLNQILANALSLGFNGFLYSGELTYQMIMEWFANKTVGRSYGRWWYAIKELPQMYAYYSMLSSGEAWRGCELSPEEYLESHPMRVFSIAHSVSISGDDNISINNLALGDFDRVLYPLCVGKLSVKEITEKLQGDYGGVDKDIFSLVKKCLAKYEAAYLIVFSKY